jgi:hypothetical protein
MVCCVPQVAGAGTVLYRSQISHSLKVFDEAAATRQEKKCVLEHLKSIVSLPLLHQEALCCPSCSNNNSSGTSIALGRRVVAAQSLRQSK